METVGLINIYTVIGSAHWSTYLILSSSSLILILIHVFIDPFSVWKISTVTWTLIQLIHTVNQQRIMVLPLKKGFKPFSDTHAFSTFSTSMKGFCWLGGGCWQDELAVPHHLIGWNQIIVVQQSFPFRFPILKKPACVLSMLLCREMFTYLHESWWTCQLENTSTCIKCQKHGHHLWNETSPNESLQVSRSSKTCWHTCRQFIVIKVFILMKE